MPGFRRTLFRPLRMMPFMRPSFLLVVLLIALAFGSAPGHANSNEPAYPAGELNRLRTGIRLAEQNERTDVLLLELRRLRDLQMQFEAVDSALSTCLRVVGISGVSQDRLAMANDWHALSTMARRSGDLSGAVAASKRRVIILKTTGDLELESFASLDLLDLLLDSKRYAEFKHQSEALLGVFERDRNEAGQVRVLYRQGEYLTAKNRAADALSLLHSALRSREVLANDQEVARILFALAKANVEVNNWVAARSAFDEAVKLTPRAPDKTPELYGLLATIHEGMEDLGGALQYVRKEAYKKDSLFSADIAERAVRMQLLYAIQANEKELTQLHEENQASASRILVEQAKTRWALVFCAALSVGLLVLLLLRFRQTISIRRSRLRNTVISGQVTQVKAKGMELERQNLLLSQALMQAKERRADLSGRTNIGAVGIQLMDLLVQTQIEQARNEPLRAGLVALHSRIKTMDLVNSNLLKAENLGAIKLKAHFTSLVGALLSERNVSDTVSVNIDMVEAENDIVDDLLPLSLLVNELLQASIDHASASQSTSVISITLRRITHQYELLYTDHSETLNGNVLSNGALGTELLLALADAMGGSILLLKSEVTTIQFTFEPCLALALGKAS